MEAEGGCFGRGRPRVHLVNKKAGRGLGFMEGVPMFTSKLGNAVKVKVLSVPLKESAEEGLGTNGGLSDGFAVLERQRDYHSVLSPSLISQSVETPLEVPWQSTENVAVSLTNVPRVRISVAGGLKVTILHEAAGGAHILPLLRLSADDIGAIVTSGSRKTRAYAELVTSADYFESQKSQWGPMLKNLMLDVSYRLASCFTKICPSLCLLFLFGLLGSVKLMCSYASHALSNNLKS